MGVETKNLMDVILTIVGMFGAAIVFIHTLREWQEAQRWKRAEQLDKFVERFDRDDLLRLACVILDWSDRKTIYNNRELTLANDDILLALRIHTDIDANRDCKFPGEQPTIRDAFDAMLAFFSRLELALTSKLIDLEPAKLHFYYWLQRLLTMDRHLDSNGVLGKQTPESMMRCYISEYGDEGSVARLREYFETGVISPVLPRRWSDGRPTPAVERTETAKNRSPRRSPPIVLHGGRGERGGNAGY